MIIQLQRRGTTNNLFGGVAGLFDLEIEPWNGEVQVRLQSAMSAGEIRVKWLCKNTYKSMAMAKSQVLKALKYEFPDQAFEFSGFIEAYMYPAPEGDKFITCAIYEPGSNTVRLLPGKNCLVAFREDGSIDLDVDPLSVPFRAETEKAVHEYLKPHNQRKSETENKAWLAWLLGEYIKNNHPQRTPVVLDSIIK